MNKKIEDWSDFKQKLENFNIALSDDEANDLLKSFNDDEKVLFEKIINQIGKENSSLIDILDDVNKHTIKGLISKLVNNSKFIEKTHEIFLNKSIE